MIVEGTSLASSRLPSHPECSLSSRRRLETDYYCRRDSWTLPLKQTRPRAGDAISSTAIRGAFRTDSGYLDHNVSPSSRCSDTFRIARRTVQCGPAPRLRRGIATATPASSRGRCWRVSTTANSTPSSQPAAFEGDQQAPSVEQPSQPDASASSKQAESPSTNLIKVFHLVRHVSSRHNSWSLRIIPNGSKISAGIQRCSRACCSSCARDRSDACC